RDDQPGLRPTLESIRRHVELEARLVDDLIDLAVLEQGRLRLDRRLVDAHEAVRRAVEVCRGAATASGQRLELDLTARRRYVEGDVTRLQQLVWNLLRNAVDHTPAGGTVSVRTRDEPADGEGPGTLIVEVADDGAGIAPGDLGRIFDAFERG